MANTYDITQKLQAIADAIENGGGGGGGTTVIANPSGTPTDTLDTIQIASTIYDIAGGGGQGFTLTNLFTEQGTPALNTKTLNDSVLNYDAIYVEGMFNGEALMGNVLLKETFENKLGNLYIGLVNFPNAYIGLTLASTATSFVTYGGGGANGITRIEGITFGSGGGGGSSSAVNVSYDNTQSGLTATNVQDAIDENAEEIANINNKLNHSNYVSVTADGVKTYAQLFNSLYALIDRTKLNQETKLHFKSGNITQFCRFNFLSDTAISFVIESIGSYSILRLYYLTASSSLFQETNGGQAVVDRSSQIPTSGTIFEVHY